MTDLTMHVAAEPSPDQKRTFLERLVETGNVMVACAQLGLPRTSVYYWKHRDADFQRAWDLAMQVHQEQLTQDVMDTARELGLGRWVQATDENGEPLLDDDFEPVMVLDVSHVDARILSKLIDKRVPSVDGPATTNLNVSTTVNNELPARKPRLVRPAPVQTASAAEDVVDAELVTEEPGDDDA
ncbi:helix-turn-helix domain-containing protein [Mameliella alba]|uniref:Terminase small subunit n=1 Tax=Mameliella alba TaxID=561184 RepID=A0A0B3S3Q0_9RHOB|nr:helix-turn-helix domain-containing protein [Mameliella alba]KHQ53598.1 hypothetical protein OA50_01585 [Mameliella alba]